MKLQNVLRGTAYIVVLAVAVLFYIQSQKAVARLAALSSPPAETAAPAPAPVPAPDPQVVAAQQYERMAKQEAAAQAARIQASLVKVAIPVPRPAPTSEPIRPAYSFAAPGPELMPLEGWVDQPNKDRPGRVHTNLMVRHVKTSQRVAPGRAPCLKMVARPAERIQRPYGWLEVPARTIPVPCGQ